MNWSDSYIGTRFEEFGRSRAGCDCWGLACVVYSNELGISLPQYLGDYASAEEHSEISALIEGAAVSPLWVPVTGPVMPFDIAVFRRGRMSSHLGIVVRAGVMIHMQGEDCAKLADYRSGRWSHRFNGHFRHVSRAVEAPASEAAE